METVQAQSSAFWLASLRGLSAEMLDLVWSTTVSDLGLVFSDLSANMDAMVYFIPQLVTAHDQSETASFLKANAKSANRALGKFYEKVG